LGDRKFCALLIDGTPFKGRQMIVALGIGHDGAKTVRGCAKARPRIRPSLTGYARPYPAPMSSNRRFRSSRQSAGM
jgi:hypothetical protein